MLTELQRSVLAQAGLAEQQLDEVRMTALVERSLAVTELTDDELLAFLQIANALYRGGQPLLSDAEYDHVFLPALQQRSPEHPFLHQVEPEPEFAGKTVALPVRMLSTDKAYSAEAIEAWLKRVIKAATELGVDADTLSVRMTPKLDGYAAFDDGQRLYTRGNGIRGADITRVFDKGLRVGGKDSRRGQGPGEIVVSKRWFDEQLAAQFDNPRNFQAAILAEKKDDERVAATLAAGAALFMPFAQLPCRLLAVAEVMAQFEAAVGELWDSVDYDVDGVILEVTDAALKNYMGATVHHHRWQIAFKVNADSAEVEVLGVTAQTSRSGRINPVVELQPTRLSGATISRATAHHYGMVRSEGIGPGARIELVRSGLVIPKIERVIHAVTPSIPARCPSCTQPVAWDGDYLYCVNASRCPAQIEQSVEHFFRTLGNVDGFGAKTVQKLHQAGIAKVVDVYCLHAEQLQAFGFGDKTAANLLAQLRRSRTEPIEDWRFLAAFGVLRLGKGNCERLLQHSELRAVFTLSAAEIAEFEGFAELTAAAIAQGLAAIRNDFEQLDALGFNLMRTPLLSEAVHGDDVLAGKRIVFTGTLQRGARAELESQARRLGATVAKAVSGKTDYLIAGEKVGEAKLARAREKGVRVLSEDEYWDLIGDLTL